jgi:SAM-dependent MidA family methyltransferase
MTYDYDPGERRATPLADIIKERIRREGPISILDYMSLCLNHPEHGYYRSKPAIGAAGDFVTAPEISQVFGEIIGLWSGVVWQSMEMPPHINLVELGPGRGTLLRDALRAARAVPGFLDALSVNLVEASARLEAEQRAALAATGLPLAWHSSAADLPPGPMIVLANEFLDACPAAQLEVLSDGIAMLGVGLDAGGALEFVRLPPVIGIDPGDLRISPVPPPGAIIEQQSFAFLLDLLWERGDDLFAGLFIDYGHLAPAAGSTLQAVRAHRAEHPLASPGEADLTVHVDFSAFRSLAEASGLLCDGPLTQAEFLGRLGIVERASRLMAANPAKAAEIEVGVARLIAPSGMGTRFKAIGVRSPTVPPLPGFA